jgi:hypothetical protein
MLHCDRNGANMWQCKNAFANAATVEESSVSDPPPTRSQRSL